jgi:peptidyl-tRNA hydrolase, PTH2 family
MSELKMWLAVRCDLNMPPGKLAAQAGHAFSSALLSAFQSDPDCVRRYQAHAMPKVVVGVRNEANLQRVAEEARRAGIPSYLVLDAGRTVFAEPTHTVCAIGPCYRSDLPTFVKRLRLLDAPGGRLAGEVRDARIDPE